MKAFVTGGTGFIGREVIRQLTERGDEVVALVRNPSKAGDLRGMGADLVEGDVLAVDAILEAMRGCDAVFHIAGVYKVGIPESEHPAMYDANVRGTEVVLDAAIEAKAPRIVYVSTANYFGNTRGEVVDETYQRTDLEFLSYYDETKYRAHEVARQKMEAGAPISIALPTGVYGPGDHSELRNFIGQASRGKLKVMMNPDLGIVFVHVSDLAGGILLVHDKGAVGESYVLGGQVGTLRDLIATASKIGGHKPPRLTMPSVMIKASIPFAPVVTRMMGLGPNLRELIRVSDGVTYWASDAKARRELGYAPRDLEEGLRSFVPAG